jgi:hypothetical protein
MSFTEKIKVQIDSVFDSTGFKRLEKNIASVNENFQSMGQFFRRAKGMGNMVQEAEEFQDVLERANLQFEEMGGRQLSEKLRGTEGFDVGEDFEKFDALGGMFKDANGELISMGEALRRVSFIISDMGTPFEDSDGKPIPAVMNPSEKKGTPPLSRPTDDIPTPDEAFSNMQGQSIPVDFRPVQRRAVSGSELERRSINRLPGTGVNLPSGTQKELSALQSTVKRVNESLSGLQTSFSRIQDSASSSALSLKEYAMSNTLVARTTNMLKGRTVQLNQAISRTGLRARIAGINVKALGGALASAAPAARNLQMKLLGLQFTMLTVAFIFGGLAMGALSAVGAFEVFGNTLRFLFLPSALNVLDLLLDFQSVVMGMDRSTRETIGNFALLAAGFAVVVGLLAALGKAVVTLVGALKTLAVASKIIIPLFQLFNTAIGTVFGLMMGLAGLLAGIAGGFLVVTRVAAKFGKKVAAVVGLILAAIGTVLAVILSAPLAVGAAIGLIIGSILGLAFVFRDTLLKIVVGTFKAIMGAIDFLISGFMGLIDFIVNDVVGGFVELFNKLVGNSIIPEMVRKIIGFIMSIPGKIANLGIQIVKTIVNGITSAGSAIFEAFKSILPDFLVNAIEGAGKAVKGIADAGGKIVDAAGNVIKGAAEAGSNLLGGGNKNSGQNKTEITNNQIDVTAEVNNSEETVGETGTKLGQSLNQTFEGKRGRREL